jgi:hypothetical protein
MSTIKMANYGYPIVISAVRDILIKHDNVYDYGMTTQPHDTFKFYFIN